MVKNSFPTLIRYGKYKANYHYLPPHKVSTLTNREFNTRIAGIWSGVVLVIGSTYGIMYYNKKMKI
jgi:hypothetical protein